MHLKEISITSPTPNKIHEKSEQQIVRGSFTALGTHCSQQISHKFNLHTFHLSGDFGSNLTIINAEPQELFGLHQEVAGISAEISPTPLPVGFGVRLRFLFNSLTLPKCNHVFLNSYRKPKIVFQPPFFRGYVN